MLPVYHLNIMTKHGEKQIAIYCCDIRDLQKKIDVLTISAFYGDYYPLKGTIIGALLDMGISVEHLVRNPKIDLRTPALIWLSRWTGHSSIHRIGCIEMSTYEAEQNEWKECKQSMFASARSYFHMLDIADSFDIPIKTIAFPILGSGNQNIPIALGMNPVISECLAFLNRNKNAKNIIFIERNLEKANILADVFSKSYTLYQEQWNSDFLQKAVSAQKQLVFISHSSCDREFVQKLAYKLEQQNIPCWYAPRDIDQNDYASSIVNAICRCTHFVVLLNKNSMQSEHVLNEIDLAFGAAQYKVLLIPILLDKTPLPPAFLYYLSRQQRTDASGLHPEEAAEKIIKRILLNFRRNQIL